MTNAVALVAAAGNPNTSAPDEADALADLEAVLLDLDEERRVHVSRKGHLLPDRRGIALVALQHERQGGLFVDWANALTP